MATFVNPLTQEDLQTIDRHIRALRDLDELVRKCEKCRIDIGQAEADRQFMMEQLARIRQEFFGMPE